MYPYQSASRAMIDHSSSPSDLQPVMILEEALENVSLGDVLQSPAALQSFNKFLRRGTSQQRDQLLHCSSHGAFAVKPPREALPFVETNNSNTTSNTTNSTAAWPSEPTPKIGHKRLLSSQQNASSSARKRRNLTGSEDTTTMQQLSLATVYTREHDREAEHSERSVNNEKKVGVYSKLKIRELAKSPQVVSYGLSNPSETPELLEKARQFFEARLNSRKNRVPYLVRAVQGFLEAPTLPAHFSKDMWNEKSAIFSKPQVAGYSARFRSLYEGHRKIKLCGEQYLSATRFCYIYLEHDLEQIMASQELVLSQGRGKVTAAFQLQAESISITMDALRAERKAGRGYIRLLMEGGPGFVLRMGNNVSTIWERKLSMSDITLIIEFIRTHAVDLYNDIKSYDQMAVQGLLDGFLAYGWTLQEIRETQSSLFHELQRHVNLEDDCLNRTCEENFAISSSPEPVLDVSHYTIDQKVLASPLFSDLDLLLDDGSQMILTPTNSIEGPEPVIINQDSEFTEITGLRIDQFSSEADQSDALNTMQANSEMQDDFNLFRDFFLELADNKTVESLYIDG